MISGGQSQTIAIRNLAFSGWLDLFRAVAALAVLYNHGRCMFLSSVTPGQELHIVTRVLYLFSGFGHQAVMVFFVLSGFLVGGTVVRANREGRWSWRRYLLQRGTRLYIVLIPALFLTLAWDAAENAETVGLTPNVDTAVAGARSSEIREHTEPSIFLGNLIFLQTVTVPTFGSNGPLWSLTNEFWYYLLFPLIWIAITRSGVHFAIRILYLFLSCGILVFLGNSVAIYFAVWVLGVAVHSLPEIELLRKTWPRRFITAIAAGFLVAALLAMVTRVGGGWSEYTRDGLIAITFSILLYCMKHNRRAAIHRTARRNVAFFADFSYTLYLVHLPPLIFLRACWTYETSWPPTAVSWGKLALILSAVGLYACLISLVTERQTERLRRWLEARLGIPRMISR